MTRPIPPRRLLASKVLLIGAVTVGAPVVADLALALKYSVPATDMVRSALQTALVNGLWVAVCFTIAVVTRSVAQFTLVCGVAASTPGTGACCRRARRLLETGRCHATTRRALQPRHPGHGCCCLHRRSRGRLDRSIHAPAPAGDDCAQCVRRMPGPARRHGHAADLHDHAGSAAGVGTRDQPAGLLPLADAVSCERNSGWQRVVRDRQGPRDDAGPAGRVGCAGVARGRHRSGRRGLARKSGPRINERGRTLAIRKRQRASDADRSRPGARGRARTWAYYGLDPATVFVRPGAEAEQLGTLRGSYHGRFRVVSRTSRPRACFRSPGTPFSRRGPTVSRFATCGSMTR